MEANVGEANRIVNRMQVWSTRNNHAQTTDTIYKLVTIIDCD